MLPLSLFLALCSCEILLFETNDDDVVNAIDMVKAILRRYNFQLVRAEKRENYDAVRESLALSFPSHKICEFRTKQIPARNNNSSNSEKENPFLWSLHVPFFISFFLQTQHPWTWTHLLCCFFCSASEKIFQRRRRIVLCCFLRFYSLSSFYGFEKAYRHYYTYFAFASKALIQTLSLSLSLYQHMQTEFLVFFMNSFLWWSSSFSLTLEACRMFLWFCVKLKKKLALKDEVSSQKDFFLVEMTWMRK